MKWTKAGSCNGMYGRQSGNYYIAKIYLMGCTLYELRHNTKLLKTLNSFEECNEYAERHQEMQMRGDVSQALKGNTKSE